MQRWKNFLVGLAVAWKLSGLACAVPVLTVPGGAGNTGPTGTTVGWEFLTTGDLSVTSFGYFDANFDGLRSSHEVGIWNSGGVLLGSAIVPSGTAGTPINNFRFVAVAPIFLAAGQIYRIGGFSDTSTPPNFDDLKISTFPTFIGPITIVSGTRAKTSAVAGFSDPVNDLLGAGNGAFGPNFEFILGGGGAPEMSGHWAASLACIGLLLSLAESRRNRV